MALRKFSLDLIAICGYNNLALRYRMIKMEMEQYGTHITRENP